MKKEWNKCRNLLVDTWSKFRLVWGFIMKSWRFIKGLWRGFIFLYTFLLLLLEISVLLTVFSVSITNGFIVLVLFIVLDIFWISTYGKKSIYVNIALSATLLVVIGTSAVYSIIYKIGQNPTIFEKLKVGESGDWIGYFGSIIGGLMTMFALIYTIQHEENKRNQQKTEDEARYKEEKASNYLPIFEIKSIGKHNGKFMLIFTSITSKPVRDFALIQQDFGNNTIISQLFSLEGIPLLANTGEYSILLDIDYDRLPKLPSTITVLSDLYFAYSDALLVKRYTHKCRLFIRFERDDSPEGYRFSTIEYIKNYPIYDSHFYALGEYPKKLEI